MMDKSDALETAFSELKENPPSVVNATRRKFGASRARKQNIAIGLSKARKMGANIPLKGKSRGV